MATPGEKVAQRRRELKLSQRSAAQLAGISPPAWGDIERDARTPSASTQRGVSTALGWPVNWYDQLSTGQPITAPAAADPLSVSLAQQVERLVKRVDMLERRLDGLAIPSRQGERQSSR